MFRVRRKHIRGSLLAHIRRTLRQWGRIELLAGRISVPEDLKWWYWQEFGTAVRGETGHASGKAYPIYPVDAQALRWPNAKVPNQPDGSRIQPFVEAHPGVPPRHFVTKSLPAIRALAAVNLFQSLRGAKLQLGSVQQSLLEKTMPEALEQISLQMLLALPGVRIDGKLHGQLAASVFKRDAFIRNTGDDGDGSARPES